MQYIYANKKSQLTKILNSIDIQHSCFLFIFVLCVVHVINNDLIFNLNNPILTTFGLFLNIYFYAAILASLIQLSTGQIAHISKKDLSENAYNFFNPYLALSLIDFILKKTFLTYFNLGTNQSLLQAPFLDTFIFYIFIRYAINKLYKRRFNIKRINTKTSLIDLVILLSINLINISLYLSKPYLPINYTVFANLPIAIYTYLRLFHFIFIVHLILQDYKDIDQNFENDNEIYFISPEGAGNILASVVSRAMKHHPASFSVLKALTPEKYKFKDFFKTPWKNRFYKPNKLVAITCFTCNCHEAYKIAKEFKKCGSKVIMGGPHAGNIPNEALMFCDSVVVGEAESIWLDILQDYENNQLKKIYYGHALNDYFDKFHNKLTTQNIDTISNTIETGRGCKFKCKFCAIPLSGQSKLRKKPLDQVIELIKIIKTHYKFFVFIDNNLYSNPKYAKELFEKLIPLKIGWAGSSSIDIAQDDQMLALAKKSGCQNLLLGYEITDTSKEQTSGGKFSLAKNYFTLSNKIKNAGIEIKAHFIYGFDSDNIKSLFNLWCFCAKLFAKTTSVSMLTPVPGSELFNELAENDRIINLNWRNYDFHHLIFQHPNITNFIFIKYFGIIQFLFLYTTCKTGIILLIITIILGLRFGF